MGRLRATAATAVLIAVIFCYALAETTLNVAMPVYFVDTLGLPGWVPGAVFVINTVMIGVGQGLVVRADDRRRTPARAAGGHGLLRGVVRRCSGPPTWLPVEAGVAGRPGGRRSSTRSAR